MLWLSCPTDEAIAPRFMPKPWTKATAILSLTPCRATTATLTKSWSRSIPRRPLAKGSVDGHALGDDLAGHDADRLRRGPWPRAAKSAAVTRRALTLSRPTGATVPRAANSSSPTIRPAVITVETAQVSRSSITTRSARQPGATRPRSIRPKMRAAEMLAAR